LKFIIVSLICIGMKNHLFYHRHLQKVSILCHLSLIFSTDEDSAQFDPSADEMSPIIDVSPPISSP